MMRGKLEIIVPDSNTVTIKGDLGELDLADKVILFNCLAEAIELDEEDRHMIGVVIAGGGIEALGGPPSTRIELASELFDAAEWLKNHPYSEPLD